MATVDADTSTWLDAILTRSYKNARQLLRADQDVNVRGADGNTALHLVATYVYDQPAKMQKLLIDGADASLRNDLGKTPLQLAQIHGTYGVSLLIEHGALMRALAVHLARTPTPADIRSAMCNNRMRTFRSNVRRRVQSQSHALIEAARTGDLATVRALVERGEITVDVIGGSGETCDETAFTVALASQQREVCEFLLSQGVHVPCHIIDPPQSQSILHMAVMIGDVGFVRRVVAHGELLPDTREDYDKRYDYRALAAAVQMDSGAMVDVLLELGVRANVPQQHEEDPYQKIPWPARDALSFAALDDEERTPWWLLAMACWHQHTSLIEHLFATHSVFSDREKMATYGAHALFLAVYRESQEIVTDLLDRGVGVNQPLDQNHTAIVAAVAVNSVRMLELLIDRGADTTVIHCSQYARVARWSLPVLAASVGAIECMRVLLPLETRPPQKDHALIQAAAHDDHQMATVLLNDALPSTLTALHQCLRKTSCAAMVDLLLTRCCGARTQDYYHVSAVHPIFSESCQTRDVDIISVFLAHGVDINYNCDHETESPLMRAVLRNYTSGAQVARLLVENGVDLGGSHLSVVNKRLQSTTIASQRVHLEACRDLLVEFTGVRA